MILYRYFRSKLSLVISADTWAWEQQLQKRTLQPFIQQALRKWVNAMVSYSKYKDCTPEETIYRIREILREIGVFPVLKWSPDELHGVCSNRVYLDPLYGLGTNGKGTSERYAEASAFAELIERVQNSILHIKAFGPEENPYPNIAKHPDEKDMDIDQLLEQNDAFLNDFFRSVGYYLQFQKKVFLLRIAKEFYGKEDGTIPVIPFADLTGDRIVWLPDAVIVSICGSNGMCAGNTMEEALVQGISEILERYAQSRILHESLTPPEIPREELMGYSLWPLVRRIEESGRYRVSIRDCSLGEEGLPVTVVVIADMEKGTFGVKFGCHPSFPVSVERTLTEAFQGKKLELFTSVNRLGSPQQVLNYDNYSNTAKTGSGFYAAAFLGEKPSWEYKPWTQWESTGNREYLTKLLALLTGKGFSPLIRDASHLGFPSYFIVVAGMSEIFEKTGLRVRDIFTNTHVRSLFRHFPDLTENEEELLLRLILFKEGSVIENGLDIISGLFLKGDLLTADRVGAYLALKKADYLTASRLFRKAALSVQNRQDSKHMNCMAEYARLMQNGAGREDSLSALTFLFGEKNAEKVANETDDLSVMMQKVFPRLKCYDCKNCKAANVHCEYPEAANILQKLTKALAEGCTLSQEQFLDNLKKLTGRKIQ